MCAIEGTRNLFIDLRLSGSVEITSSFAAFSVTNSVEIDASEDKVHESEDLMKEKEGRTYRTAMELVKRSLKRLVLRASVYKSRPYAKNTSLSETISINFALFGLELCLSTSVESLLGITEADVGEAIEIEEEAL
jgi:hypothetical protein